MSDTIKNILFELLLLPKETEWVEFKKNNFYPKEIGEYISALSNSACLHNREKAYLVFGVDDVSHIAIGTDFKPKQEKVGNQELENWIATQLEPRIDFKIHEVVLDNNNLVIFEIDTTFNTPVKFKGNEYIRVGSYKHSLDKFPEKAREIWGKNPRRIFEKDIAKNGISSDEVLELLDYPEFFSLSKQKLPDNRTGILEKLESEKVIIKNRNDYDITNLGAILFAKKLSDFENLGRKAVRVIIYKGKNRLCTIKEQVGAKGYAVGFEGLIDFINGILPSNEILGKALREEVKMYPESAIRELVANALIHQDFDLTGTSPMIEIFDDRIEFSNPGTPLINTLRFIDHMPKSRNEMLATFMKRVGICEERGSGIDKVINEVEKYQLPAPNFIEDDIFFKAILFAHNKFEDMNKEDRIRACYQHCCLKYVSNELMTNQSLRKRFEIEDKNYPMISKIISNSLKKGLMKDSDQNRKYIPFWA